MLEFCAKIQKPLVIAVGLLVSLPFFFLIFLPLKEEMEEGKAEAKN